MITTASRVLLAGLLEVGALPAGADELLMKDGSRLLGKVIRKEGDTLEFETGYAGVIRVKWTEVGELHSEEPVRVLMDDKAVLSATTIRNTDAATLLETGPDQEPGTVAAEKVAYINPAPWRMGEGVRWTGHINIDLELDRGNSDEDDFNLDGKTRFRRKNDRLTISGQYEEDRSDGVVTTEKWHELNKYDYFITDKLYYGALLGFEHDKFSDLDLRTSVGPHVGYQFFESKELNLDVDVGALYVDEDNEEADDDQRWSLGWSIDFDWFLLPDRIQFYHKHVGLQDVSEKDNLVIDSWTGFRFPVYAGIVASTEAEIDYDGGISGDIDKLDTTYRFMLGYQW